MSLADLAALPIASLAAPECHLWLWTTNARLHDGFHLLGAWGARYLAPITWCKPSGCGNYWVHRTQTLLFAYYGRCHFPLARYRPTVLTTTRKLPHSQKPEESYALIEAVSPPPRLELFARRPREGWDVVGNEIDGRDIRDALAALIASQEVA